MKNINEIIKKNIIEIAGNPKSICVAFSGGPDSVCLLHSLNNISAEIGFTLSAVHVNHNIRDNEAKRDAAFCVDFCERISVPIKVFDVNVPQDAQKGESIELAARRLRYEIFEKALYQASCKAAIKAGRIYDREHIKWIVERVLTLDNIKYCPHGRPVAFEITKRFLEKEFERIK